MGPEPAARGNPYRGGCGEIGRPRFADAVRRTIQGGIWSGVLALAIISQPKLNVSDGRWLEALRKRHDPLAGTVAAHFTLVFPFEGGGEGLAGDHAAAIAGRTPAIDFRLTKVAAVRDSLAPRSHVFLLPDPGEAAIRQLHDDLYDGPLAPHLRADILYRPHVTVAAVADHAEAETIASGIGALAIEGRLTALQLVGFDGRTVTPLASLPLTG